MKIRSQFSFSSAVGYFEGAARMDVSSGWRPEHALVAAVQVAVIGLK